MKGKLLLSIVCMIILTCSFVLQSPLVSAGSGQVYMGAFFYNSPVAVRGVSCGHDFWIEDSSELADYEISSVISVAGGDDQANPSGMIYQNSVFAKTNDEVIWNPQNWDRGTKDWQGTMYYLCSWSAGDVEYYTRIDITGTDSNTFNHSIFVYKNGTYMGYMRQKGNTDDTKVIVGRDYEGGKYIKQFQWGVESKSYQYDTDWEVRQFNMCYYSGGDWHYKRSRVCNGYNAEIVDHYLKIGGFTYYDVDADYNPYEPAEVTWEYNDTTTTVQNNIILWSSNGVISDSAHSEVYVYWPWVGKQYSGCY